MRLNKSQLEIFKNFSKDIKGDFYIFGSRLDDTKRGGDIDLLVINKSELSNIKLSLLIERTYFKQFEEKIDVVVFAENMTENQKIFFNSIKKQAIGTN